MFTVHVSVRRHEIATASGVATADVRDGTSPPVTPANAAAVTTSAKLHLVDLAVRGTDCDGECWLLAMGWGAEQPVC